MANTKSALKRARQTETRTERNRAMKSKVRTLRKKVAVASASGDEKAAIAALSAFTSVVDRAAKKNLIHKNNAANLKSKAAKAIKIA